MTLEFARSESAQGRPGPPTAAGILGRPFGYLFAALLWTAITAVTVGLLVLFALPGFVTQDGSSLTPPTGLGQFLLFLIVSPLLGWFVLMLGPGCISQTVFMWTFFVRSLNADYARERISFNAGSTSRPILFPVRQTRWSAFWSIVDRVGWTPPWIVLGAGTAAAFYLVVAQTRFFGLLPGSLGAAFIATIGVGILVIIVVLLRRGIQLLLSPRKKRREIVLDEKYYKGLAARERGRANKLRRAREAGAAEGARLGTPPTDFDRWIAAEVDQLKRDLGGRVLAVRRGDESTIAHAVATLRERTKGAVDETRLRALVTESVILKRNRKKKAAPPVAVDRTKPQPPAPKYPR